VLNVAKDYIGASSKAIKFEKNGRVSYLWSNSPVVLRPTILLLGHLDVVDGGEDLNIFMPQIKKGLLTGRGAGDMKGYASVILYCYKHLLEVNKDASVALLLTTDEEVGGSNGSKYVVDSGLSPEVVFIPDAAVDFNVVTSEKAPHHFILRAQGKGGHASRSFEINNPLDRICDFYAEARKYFQLTTKNNNWASTFDMTTIKSDSDAKNSIPSVAEASFSWRWPLEHIDFETGRKQILKIASKHSCDVILEEGWGEGVTVSETNPYIVLWKKNIEQHLGRRVEFTKVHGSSDGRHFFNSKNSGSKNIVLTAANSGGHHSSFEWVDINSLVILAKALTDFIDEVLSDYQLTDRSMIGSK
jgi:succinyl-diaminopimelate desuccinylase